MEKRKMKKRHLSSWSSSSSDSGEELRLLQRLEAERLRLKEEKKKQKEQLKANETPAEKRARRLRKKQEKDCKYREQMGWDNEYQCYTNQDNPFGDSALTDTFVWTKKLVQEGVKTVSRNELEALSRQKQQKNKIELKKIFKGKTVAQLEALQKQMEHKMRGRRDGVDVAYWESLLSQLKAHKSRARLRERHQRLLRRQLPPLQRERAGQRAAATQDAEEPRGSQSPKEERAAAPVCARVVETGAEQSVDMCRAATHEARLARRRATAAGGLVLDQMEPAVGSADDQPQLSAPRPGPDRWRPRKPRYYNRVHTGFEWNKYNQTHYDVDNPPPRIVQGYKFNIFYPDLIDKTATPLFSVKVCPENADLAVVRFQAGAPYEDIAFQIVNHEWERSHKRGFRCHFRNNIFQLWFHFKRYRYRR